MKKKEEEDRMKKEEEEEREGEEIKDYRTNKYMDVIADTPWYMPL